VEAEIRVSGGQGGEVDEVGELAALFEWLRGERGLAGAVREVRVPPGPGELGGAVEVLAVVLGTGGAAGTLVTSLFGWLRARRPNLKVTVTKGKNSVTIEASQVRDGDVLPLLREVLESKDGL
jgi:Effector Associated Constant Component 1